MLDPAIRVWTDRFRSAEAGEAPRCYELRAAPALRANPITGRVEETTEVNNTAGG
jgi:hypothetical protein